MTQKTLILPFVVKTPSAEQNTSHSEEIAVIACLAESQRKKPSILRDASERIASISKVFYPMWILQLENSHIILDGLAALSTSFSFEEPIKTTSFIEELKRNSANPDKFYAVLKEQASQIEKFTKSSTTSFPALINDKEILGFTDKYFQTGVLRENEPEDVTLIPTEVDAKSALQTSKNAFKCIRIMEAHAKGIAYALNVLDEEVKFHTNATTGEIEYLEQKRDLETAAIRPAVDKAIKKITQKQDKAIVLLQRSSRKEIGALERKRENLMRRLQIAEQRRDSVRSRIEAAKQKKRSKSSSGSFALQKYERDVDHTKKEIKIVSEQLDKTKREAENNIKLKKTEFQNASDQEENKITQINTFFNTKKNEKQKQIDEMKIQTSIITQSLESKVTALKRSSDVFRNLIEVELKSDTLEGPVLAKVPIYVIKYAKAKEERYLILSPIVLSEDMSVLSGLKNVLAVHPEPKLRAITHPASKKLQETINMCLQNKMQIDENFMFRITELCKRSNLLDLNNFGQTLNEGLDDLERKGWMRREDSSTLCRHVLGDST